jgi:hypothetical protein
MLFFVRHKDIPEVKYSPIRISGGGGVFLGETPRGNDYRQKQKTQNEKKKYLKLKEEALDRTLWRTRFGRGYGPVVRQTTEWMNKGI